MPEFIKEIEACNLTEAQIRARENMNDNSAREGTSGRRAQRQGVGMTEKKWELGAAEHCDDCVAYAAMGWQPFGTFPTPGAGDTRCMTNCKCHIIYQNPETGARY
jgi:hypothetical protein